MTKLSESVDRLTRAEWLKRPETQRILSLLDGAAGRTRAVGGIVRDTLLGLPLDAADVDLATELEPEEVAIRAERLGISVYPTGIEHGTITLRLGALTAEVTTLREDIETDGRRAVVRFGTSWTRDAQRRDFTLNALYADMNGRLFDPLGGLDDCLNNRVRFIGDPTARIAEDRLRVYRFFRFSASHAREQLDADGLAACKAAAGTLGRLAAERVGSEMLRMLGLPRIANTLKAMTEAGILELPNESIAQLHAYERRARRPDHGGRLAILSLALGSEDLQQRWRLSNDDLRVADSTLAAARLIADFNLNEAAYRYPAVITDAIEVAATIANWGDAGRLAVVERLQHLDVPSFPIGGQDLIAAGLTPGPALGRELERLERAWIESEFALDRQALLGLVRAS